MYAPMTVWAQGYHEQSIVRAAIAYAANMVRLKIWTSIFPQERCRSLAALAISGRASQDVVSNVTAALINISDARCFRERYNRRRDFRESSEFIERLRAISFQSLFHRLDDRTQWPEFEYNSRALVTITVRRFFDMMLFADHFAKEP
jgi:hypothetical protein